MISSPTERGLIKIRKPNSSIIWVVNGQNATGCRLSKLNKNVLYSVYNSPTPSVYNRIYERFKNQKTIPINQDTRLASFDVTDMYTNIPTTDSIQLLTQNSKNCGETRK
jgi:hypothetical protein